MIKKVIKIYYSNLFFKILMSFFWLHKKLYLFLYKYFCFLIIMINFKFSKLFSEVIQKSNVLTIFHKQLIIF